MHRFFCILLLLSASLVSFGQGSGETPVFQLNASGYFNRDGVGPATNLAASARALRDLLSSND